MLGRSVPPPNRQTTELGSLNGRAVDDLNLALP